MFIVELNSINLTPGSAEKSKRIAFQKRGRGRDKHTDENFLDESSGIQVPLGLWNLPAEMVIKERSQGFNNLDSKRWVKLGPWLGIKVVERIHLTCISPGASDLPPFADVRHHHVSTIFNHYISHFIVKKINDCFVTIIFIK